MDGSFFLNPLNASLAVAIAGPYPWAIMRETCVQLVECYADRSLDWGETTELRLQMALQYLISAIKISNQLRIITNDSIGLSSDKAFSVSVPEAITDIMVSSTSSSATIAASAAPAFAVDPKAKALPKGASIPSAAGPDGRDSLFLLSAMLREGDFMWLDSFERDDAIDMHLLMKRSFPTYAAKCTLTSLPSIETPTALQVAPQTVSSLYCPATMPRGFPEDIIAGEYLGLYSHVASYFILGIKNIPGPGESPKTPQLTKIVLLKRDLKRVEKSLRDLRDSSSTHRAKGNAEALIRCADMLALVLAELLMLLSQGFIDTPERAESKSNILAQLSDREREKDMTPRITVEDQSVKIYFPAMSQECILPMNEGFMGDLADLLSSEKDMESINNAAVCSLFRASLGYRD